MKIILDKIKEYDKILIFRHFLNESSLSASCLSLSLEHLVSTACNKAGKKKRKRSLPIKKTEKKNKSRLTIIATRKTGRNFINLVRV